MIWSIHLPELLESILIAKKRVTIRSTIDCLIAQTVIEHDLFLLHNDNDFTIMATAIALKIY
jgi:predicted nucleic acid-binding protein